MVGFFDVFFRNVEVVLVIGIKDVFGMGVLIVIVKVCDFG